MSPETHSQLANFIWSICNLLRGPYKRNEYRKVILPLTVLRRFDCVLAPTKERVLKEYAAIKNKPESVVRSLLEKTTGRPFYNLSKLDFAKLLDDPNQLALNLNAYITKGFSKNVREIMDRFAFGEQIARMAEKNLLYEVIKAFAKVDLSPARVDNVQMGYVFEELIRIGAEQANEEAGEHFTPREVIRLMVNLLLSPEKDLRRSHVVKTIYDPACGTGGMLSEAEKYIRALNSDAKPLLFGQDWNDESWAVCKSDMLIKGEEADNIVLNDSFTKDGFDRDTEGKKVTFDYMLANPPFGVEWKQQQRFIEQERDTLGYDGRFGAGTPRINDGALLFLQHMLSKMRAAKKGGSRIGIVFNGSPLFTGDAGSGESNIRQWIIENDWLEAVVALPDQLFYNTGISTYIWVLTNRKEPERKGTIQLIDARRFFVKMKKSLGNKRNKIGDPSDDAREPDQIADVTRIFGSFQNGETRALTVDGQPKTLVVSKVFDTADFGFHKITVERPLRLNFQVTPERIARLEEESGFRNLATSNKKNEKVRLGEIEAGKQRQEAIRSLLRLLARRHAGESRHPGGAGAGQALDSGVRRNDDCGAGLVRDDESTRRAGESRHPGGAGAGQALDSGVRRNDDCGAGLVRDDETTRHAGEGRHPGGDGVAQALDSGVRRNDDQVGMPTYRDREPFLADLKSAGHELDVRLTTAELKAVLNALGERDDTAEICRDKDGNPEPDPELRDTENVPLKESIETYFQREVLPHVPDAWIDHDKTKVGYEIPLNRHFYRYEPPRPLEAIEADIKGLENEILALLKEVAA